jgi:hypothetical protein
VIALLWIVLLMLIVWLLSLAIGNGRCHDCGRFCAPWSVYCHRHDPFGGAR